MMKKQILALALSALLFVFGALAEAQQPTKIPRIGLLITSSAAATASFVDALQQGLRELGYVEGKNIAIGRRFAELKFDRLPDLATELVGLKVDVIVAAGSNVAVRAAQQATSTIPIIIITASDPVELGHVASLARPGWEYHGIHVHRHGVNGKTPRAARGSSA